MDNILLVAHLALGVRVSSTSNFFVDDMVSMAPGPWPCDTTNGIVALVNKSVGDVFLYSYWGGPTRKMEVTLSVEEDLVDDYRNKLQAALGAGTVTLLGFRKPTVEIQVKEIRQAVRPICSCGDDDDLWL